MIAQALVLFVVPAILALSAGWDLASYTIPNFLSIALLGLFVVFAAVSGMAPGEVGMHALAGVVGLAMGFALFAFGLIGGGDAKLFAVVVLWLGFKDLLDFVLMTSVFGGALTIVLIGLRNLPMPASLAGQSWLLRLHDARSGIPYGVALAAGALVILPHTEIFRLATA
jgi:prepilin peptidase CpaA